MTQLCLGVFGQGLVRLEVSRKDAKRMKNGEAFPVCIRIFASLRLERSGREVHGVSSMPLAMRLMPSFDVTFSCPPDDPETQQVTSSVPCFEAGYEKIYQSRSVPTR